jgi:hypothetical protein
MELQSRFKASQAIADGLVPGVMVKEKLGLGFLRKAEPMILWALLDRENTIHLQIVASMQERTSLPPDIDCFVAITSTTGSTLMYMPHSLSALEVDSAYLAVE